MDSNPRSLFRWNDAPDCFDQIEGINTASQNAKGMLNIVQIASNIGAVTRSWLVVMPRAISHSNSLPR